MLNNIWKTKKCYLTLSLEASFISVFGMGNGCVSRLVFREVSLPRYLQKKSWQQLYITEQNQVLAIDCKINADTLYITN